MKKIKAENNQTLWDIAIQYLGDILSVFDILVLNPSLTVDQELQSGFEIILPDTIIEPKVSNYFSNNNIVPCSGMYFDPFIQTQDLNWDIAQGANTFDGVNFPDLVAGVTMVLNYSGLNSADATIYFDQSLDGDHWVLIPGCYFILNPSLEILTINVPELTTNYIRMRLACPDSGMTGILSQITFTT